MEEDEEEPCVLIGNEMAPTEITAMPMRLFYLSIKIGGEGGVGLGRKFCWAGSDYRLKQLTQCVPINVCTNAHGRWILEVKIIEAFAVLIYPKFGVIFPC